MLCITIAKLGGYREEKMITFPASFRSSNYNYHRDDLVSEVHVEAIGRANKVTSEVDVMAKNIVDSVKKNKF